VCKIVQRSCLVICPLHPWMKHTVYTKTTVTEDGKTFAMCNGCDAMEGRTQCQKCCAAITLMYMRGEPMPAGAFPPPLHLLGEADRVTGAEPG
jgi:hypothetical protein